MKTGIKKIIMDRDGLTSEEAHKMIIDAQIKMNQLSEKDDWDSAIMVIETDLGIDHEYAIELLNYSDGV